MIKIKAFLENTEIISTSFGITPLLYGSLGLEYLTGSNLKSDDIDILIPGSYLTDKWQEFRLTLEQNGYILIDEHEHSFERDGNIYSYAKIEELESFADIQIKDIITVEKDSVKFSLLSLEQYLKVYSNSIHDGYRIDVRHKKRFRKN